MTKNIYQQQIDDFLCRARIRLGELAAGENCGGCGCHRQLMGDLWAAIRTLTNCHSDLTWAEKLRIVELMTSRACLGQIHKLGGVCGIIVREGGCGLGMGNIALPLPGEQVTVRVEGHTRQLQSVITELYNRASNIYFIDGGTASAKFHPTALNR
jgi:hypothetical protein